MTLKENFYRNLYRKRKYKPLYKQFINLKKNIQQKKEITFFKFKRIKWQNFKNHNFKNSERNFLILDHDKYSSSIVLKTILKKYFAMKLETKKKLFLFYGKLSKKCFLKYLNFIKKKNLNLLLLEILEMRLDLILYRSHFVSSIRLSRQLILHKHIFVNKKKVISSTTLLKNGDLVQVDLKLHFLVLKNINQHNFWPIPPKYLQINYNTLQILFNHKIKFNNLFSHFSFWLNLNVILNYYKI